jgi:aminopeptidase N
MSKINAQKREVILDFHKNEQLNWQQQITSAKFFNDNADFDIIFYYLNIEIEIASPYIQGSVLCKFRSEIDSLKSIKLNFHHSLNVDSIKGKISDYIIVDDTIMINLSEVLPFKEIDEVIIYYQGVPELAYGYKGLRYESHGNNEPIIASLSTPYFAHYWWPCKDGPGDKADSVYIDITIPDMLINNLPLLAISNGLLENEITTNGMKTFQWRERYPIAPYYVMVAISNYDYIKQYYSGIDENSYFNEYYVFDEYLDEAKEGIEEIPEAINMFSNYFGDYPFKNEKYGMTQIGFYGAIENQTNTIINNMSLDWYLVSIHELAHMWFGDMITCKTWHHAWLNEGFASYCEALWIEKKGGFDEYKQYISYFEYYQDGTIYLEDISDPFNIFTSIVFDKGAYTLHMLRGVMGDSIFFNCLFNYATNEELMYMNATTEDFISICEETFKQDLDWFFNQWVYDEYFPIYEYNFYQNPSTFEIEVQINQIQSNYGRRDVFKMPIQLKLNFMDSGDTIISLWNDQKFQTFNIDLAKAVDSIEFDPDNWILKDVHFVNSIAQKSEENTPENTILLQNFPNPFNSSTNISYSISRSDFVKVKIYDILGREILTIVEGFQSIGNYTINVDTINFSTGIYFYRLRVGDINIDTKKMILVR